ncbi:MAG: HtpX-2 peptidase, heat shock protein HtpX [Microgenomates group bacterium GW2011_GWC1_44_37]|uniref:Protease HtpX homolog n=1 Tax=Candidatus Collierbacteria bacterium GW2011_GWB2_44_22 TaxID=1618387 RepID=A0A0G1HZX6_9BACT|nr:MAG: Protease HtpX-like protein [Candidatus Collierbacteria bacterium GW2011_GWA2_44_13]KKT52098.1 MAG: Protease HtpX-like protein [Candidatus Collierbacteria bacterium GW2011_GWB2_44_22]KKT63087.1 MAG: Protease HtpX-like protein [Candidatus Collierbacteria bacterium GW2011_GWD1_44_27]KKT66301.1 MAG: Protease HtpX-like protein [Candidatus Collierbacteria bacterium GW2011_GWC2_44_30]KKT68974.1 MAG: HtpX-2 peptidase, heat shock protein HtpX [Microgenomates group bacterium GW2011_GWC1_44_37]KK
MKNIYEQVDENKFRSVVVITSFIVFITAATYLITYSLGYDLSAVGIALVLSGIFSFIGYYNSDKIILGISGASPANKGDHFEFYTVTENLARVARIPMPKLYVIDDTAMNAFATGRDPEHAVVCATTGILSKLNRTEMEGVVAHELSHIRNYDIRLMSIVTILVGLVTLLADILLRTRMRGKSDREEGNLGAILMIAGIIMALLSPLVAQLIQLAISRRREFFADASGALLTKYPAGLASALEKISADKEPLEAANKATAHLYIANPLKNHHDSIGWFADLFNTHPPVKERIKALRAG